MTTNETRIRDASPADMAATAAIYGHYVMQTTFTFEEIAPGADEMRRRHEEIRTSGLPYLVAEQDGRIVGFAYAGPFRQRSAYRFTVEDSIYIAPSHARRGIGKALLDQLIARCAARGFRQMIAVIGDSTNAASIGLHASHGFQPEGLLRGIGLKFGRWLDVALMRRTLGEHPQVSQRPPGD